MGGGGGGGGKRAYNKDFEVLIKGEYKAKELQSSSQKHAHFKSQMQE